jgi:hypothetical protein
MSTESARDGMHGGIAGGVPLVVVRVPPTNDDRGGAMRRRRLAAAALAALTAALLILPGVAAGAQTGGGDALVANARFPSASDYQELPAGSADLEVRKAGSGKVLARADNVQLAGGSISSLVAVGGIGEKLELLDISDAATAVSAAGFVVQQRRSTG